MSHARSRRMKSKLQRFEFEALLSIDNNFPIQHALFRQLRTDRLQQLGEKAIQAFLVAALNGHIVPIAKDQRAKPIPFRFEDPCGTGGQLVYPFGKHRWQWGTDCKTHR